MALVESLDTLVKMCARYRDPASYYIAVVCKHNTMYRTLLEKLIDRGLHPVFEHVKDSTFHVVRLRNDVCLYIAKHPSLLPDRMGRMKKKPEILFYPPNMPKRPRAALIQKYIDKETDKAL